MTLTPDPAEGHAPEAYAPNGPAHQARDAPLAVLRGAALVLALALGACGLPRDPKGTADHVRNGVLRVGVSENPPWTDFAGAEPSGLEPSLVRAFAGQQHARVVWVRNGETPLLQALKDGKLDLVVGGLDSRSPWAKSLGATRPYVRMGGRGHVWLTAPGENRFLLRLDRFLAAHKAEAASQLNQGRLNDGRLNDGRPNGERGA